MRSFVRYLIVFGGLLSAWEVKAEKLPVAGEVLSKSSTSPYVEFDPHPNIMGFFTPRPIERETEDIYFSAIK